MVFSRLGVPHGDSSAIIGDTSAKYAPVKMRFGRGMETESRISYTYSRTIKVNLLRRVEEVYLMDLMFLFSPPAMAPETRTVAGFQGEPKFLFVGMRFGGDDKGEYRVPTRCWLDGDGKSRNLTDYMAMSSHAQG